MKPVIFLLSILMSCWVSAQTINTENAYYKVYEAAKKAQQKDVEGIRALYKMSLEDHGDTELNKMMIKTIMLSMIKSSSKALKNYMPAVDAKFIGLGTMEFLYESPLQVKCNRCRGDGVEEDICRQCFKGTCKNCKGNKQISYKGLGGKLIVKKCDTCARTGKCQNCEGTGIAKTSCRGCYEKGTVFSRNAVPGEYDASLKHMVDYIPQLAAEKDIYITEQIIAAVKKQELKEQLAAARKAEKKRREAELAKKKAEQEALAAKVAAAKKAAGKLVTTTKRSPGYDAKLDHPLLEFNQFFRNRERISKQSLYENADAAYTDGKPTLTIDVKSTILKSKATLRMQYLEAFYQFWKLRCTSNRVGSNVGFIVTYKGKKVAELVDGEIKFG